MVERRKVRRKPGRAPSAKVVPISRRPEPAEVPPVTLEDPVRFWSVAHMMAAHWLGEIEAGTESELMLWGVAKAIESTIAKTSSKEVALEMGRALDLLEQLEANGTVFGIEREG